MMATNIIYNIISLNASIKLFSIFSSDFCLFHSRLDSPRYNRDNGTIKLNSSHFSQYHAQSRDLALVVQQRHVMIFNPPSPGYRHPEIRWIVFVQQRRKIQYTIYSHCVFSTFSTSTTLVYEQGHLHPSLPGKLFNP